MRFVPTHCLREGYVVGKNIFDKNANILLMKGAVIKSVYSQKLIEHGINGIYIDDDLSKDIEIIGVITDNLKIKAVKSIKSIFINSEQKNTNVSIEIKKEQEINDIVNNLIDEILDSKNLVVNMVDLKVFDDYTFFHSVNVAVLSIIVGVSLGLNRVELYRLGMGALLHDVGKVFISKDILNKKDKLNDIEFEEIKKHSELGYKYLREKFTGVPVHSYIGAYEHHERFDGRGYPLGKKGKNISLIGRIIAIADVYDALTSDRPYRKAMLASEAMEYLMGGCDTFFDGELIKIFLKKIAPYPLGTIVKLSNGFVGIVIKNFENIGLRPIIKIFKENDIEIEPYFLDLRNDAKTINVTIVDTLQI